MLAVLTALLVLAFAVPSAASAQSSSRSGTTDSELGSLPFNGLDVGWMIGGAIILTAVGVGMGRAATRSTKAG